MMTVKMHAGTKSTAIVCVANVCKLVRTSDLTLSNGEYMIETRVWLAARKVNVK